MLGHRLRRWSDITATLSRVCWGWLKSPACNMMSNLQNHNSMFSEGDVRLHICVTKWQWIRLANAGLLLGRLRRRLPDIVPALCQRVSK